VEKLDIKLIFPTFLYFSPKNELVFPYRMRRGERGIQTLVKKL